MEKAESPNTCRLCGKIKKLRKSHTIPSFAVKYLKGSSVTGVIRPPKNINIPKQDVTKHRLYCSDCEALMQREERYFASYIFHPFHDNNQLAFSYNYHLQRFCIVLAFRILTLLDYLFGDFESRMRPSYAKNVRKAIEVFRDFLLSGAKSNIIYSSHLLFFDLVQSVGDAITDIPPSLNFYLYRTVDMDLPYTNNFVYTYCKLCKLALITFIIPQKPKKCVDTRVFTEGKIGCPQKINIPGLGQYLFQRANIISDSYNKLSEKQLQKIQERMQKNNSIIPFSQAQQALEADVRLQSTYSNIQIYD